MNVTKLTYSILLGISILLLENRNSFAAQEDPLNTEMYKMLKGLQASLAHTEPPLFALGKQFTIKDSPVYLQYSDNVSYRPDPRDLVPVIRKGFKIYTRVTPSTEVGYLIVQSIQYPHFSEPTIDLSWLFINENERNKHYGTYAVRVFEGIFKNHTDKFANVSILSARTNENNQGMRHILEKSGWVLVKERVQPNMVEFIKERPKK
jgi:hypothetical protein